MNFKSLSVVVPAYNEEERIEIFLKEIVSYLRENRFDFEILVIDDGSSDRTREKIQKLQPSCPEIQLLIHPKNAGKGTAVKTGIQNVSKDFSLLIDADNSTRIFELEKMEPKVISGARFVVGSRHLKESKVLVPQPWARRTLGGGYRALSRSLFGVRGSDFNCGFKLFESRLAKDVFREVEMNDWSFDLEVFCRMAKRGVIAQEIPVQWTHYGKNSHSSPWVTAWRTLGSLSRLKKILASR